MYEIETVLFALFLCNETQSNELGGLEEEKEGIELKNKQYWLLDPGYISSGSLT